MKRPADDDRREIPEISPHDPMEGSETNLRLPGVFPGPIHSPYKDKTLRQPLINFFDFLN